METITLETYGRYHENTDDYDTKYVTLPRAWLAEYLKDWYDKDCGLTSWEIVENFLMNYDWDWAEQIENKAKADLREIVEVCPHCMAENTPYWDVEKYGYEITCIDCGADMMLCDECMHAEDNEGHRCDWCETGCFRKENK